MSRILGHKGGRDDTLEGTGVLEIYGLGVSGSGFADFGSCGDPTLQCQGEKTVRVELTGDFALRATIAIC